MFNSRRRAYIVGGLLCGALFVIGWAGPTLAMFVLAEDEERPPIIVRGGSLIFESGAAGKPGKPWKKETVVRSGKNETQWKPDHPTGIPTGALSVAFTGGTDAAGKPCATVSVPEVTITYDPDGTGSRPAGTFLITRRPRAMGKGTLAPTIVETTIPLSPDAATNTLTAAGSDKTMRFEYVSAGKKGSCDKPTSVQVNSRRK